MEPWICDIPLSGNIRNFLHAQAFATTAPRHAPVRLFRAGTAFSCVVNDRPISCDVIMPSDADVVRLTAPVALQPMTAYPQADARVRQPVPPIPFSSAVGGSSSGSDAQGSGLLRVQDAPASDLAYPAHPPPVLSSTRPGRWRLPWAVDCGMSSQPPSSGLLEQRIDMFDDRLILQFTVFDVHRNARVLPLPLSGCERAIVNAAVQATPELGKPFEYRFLRFTLEHWPEPQLVIHERLPVDQVVVPIALDNPFQVCTLSLDKVAAPFAAMIRAAEACDLPKSVYQAIARGDAQLWVNNRHRSPFAKDAFRVADSAKYKVAPTGPVCTSGTAIRRWPQTRVLSLPEFRVRDISDGIPTLEVVVHCLGEAPHCFHVDAILRPYLFSQFLRRARGKPTSWHIVIPEASPGLPGSPAHVLLTPARVYAQEWTTCIVDLRRVATAPLLPFIAVDLPRFMVPSQIVALLRRELPSIAPIGRIFIDWDLLTRPAQITSSVPVVTLIGGSRQAEKCLLSTPPALLHTYALLSLRPGFGPAFANTQHTLRVIHYVAGSDSDSEEDVPCATSSTTSTTVTAMLASTPTLGDYDLLNPLPDIWTRPFKFFLAGCHNRFVSCVVPGRDDTSQVLAVFSWQLARCGEPPAGDMLRSCTRIFFEPGGPPQIFAMMTRPQAPLLIWIDARPMFSQPIVFQVVRPMSARDLVTLAGIPHTSTFFLSVNGQPWRGTRRVFHRGDVFTVRLSHSGLFNIPINCVAPRFEAIQMLVFDLHGPDAPVTASVRTFSGRLAPISASRSQLEDFWHQVQCNVCLFMGLDLPFSRVTLFAPGMPPLVCSARTRIPPSAEQLQAWWDAGPAQVFGQHQWVDLKLLEGDTCLFMSQSALQHRQRAWRLGLTDASDIWWSDDLGDALPLMPASAGYVCRPVAVTPELGFCCLLPADQPPPMVLFPTGETGFSMLAIRPSSVPPWCLHWLAASEASESDDDPLALPRVSFISASEGSGPPSSQSSSEAASVVSAADAAPVPDLDAMSLLQTKAVLSSRSVGEAGRELRFVPTACRNRGRPIPLHVGDIYVWTRDLGRLSVTLFSNDTFVTVLEKVRDAGARVEQLGLVPCYPQQLCPGHFLLAPLEPSVVTVAVVADFNEGLHLWSLPAGTTGSQAEAVLAPAFRFVGFCGTPLHSVQHLFDGMVLTACPAATSVPHLAQGCRLRVSLTAALKPDVDSRLSNWHAAMHIVAQLGQGQFFQPSRDLDLLSLDWPLRRALATCRCGVELSALPPGSEAHVFTDGSQHATSAGWGVVCAVWTPGLGWCWQGCLGASSSSRLFVEEHHDSCEAEASAMMAAFVWALQLPVGVPLYVGYDCEGAARAADGAWPVPVTASGQLRRTHAQSRVLFLLHEAMGREIHLCHLHSHTGEVWNDLADATANFAAAGLLARPVVPAGWVEFLTSPEFRWIWMLPAGVHTRGLPDVADLIVGEAKTDVEVGVPALPRRAASSAAEHVVSVCCATFNACTLTPADDRQLGLYQASVQRLLQAQCCTQGIVVLGIQETRLPSSCQYATEDFLVFNAAAESGHFGCSLWLSRRSICKVANADLPGLELRHCTVLVAEPRLLIVRVRATAISWLCVVAHAPHSRRPAPERTAWWDHLETVYCSVRRPEDITLVCIDANARVGSPSSEFVGSHHADVVNANGLALESFLRIADLFLPATTEVHQGSSHTWHSPSGTTARLDFVALPRCMRQSVQTSWIWDCPDVLQQRPDHRALVLDFTYCRTISCEQGGRSDRLCVDVAQAAAWRRAVDSLPLLPWNLSVDAHEVALTKSLHTQARPFKHARRVTARRPFVGDQVRTVIAMRKHVRHRMYQDGAARNRLWCGWILRAWRAASHPSRDFDGGPNEAFLGDVTLHQQVRAPFIGVPFDV